MSRSSQLTRTVREVVMTKEAQQIRDRLDMVMTEVVITSKQINAIRDSRMIVEETRDNRMTVEVTRDNRMTVEEINLSVIREIAAIQRILVTLTTPVTQETLATPVIQRILVTLATPVTQEILVTLVIQETLAIPVILVTRSKETDMVTDHLNSNVINVIAETSVINVTKDKAIKDKEIDKVTDKLIDKVINMVTDRAIDRAIDKSTIDRVIDSNKDRKMTDRENPPSLCQLQRN